MSILLGVYDERVTDSTKTSYRDNKIGGRPDWPGRSPDILYCDVCGKELLLVVQVYCPLDQSPYHRVLYVFGCVLKSCWNQSQSWKVIRCQEIDEACHEQTEVIKKEAVNDSWGDGADDWFTDDDSDWQGGDTAAMITTHHVLGSAETRKESASHSEDNTAKLAEDKLVLSDKLQEMLLDDVTNSEFGGGGDIELVSSCTPEDLPRQRPEDSVLLSMVGRECQELHANAAMAPSSDVNNQALCCYYISVFDEPESGVSSLEHEQELLKHYSMKEGIDITRITSEASSGEGEKYERSHLKHGDAIFHRFHKRISRCPQQLLRYSYKGEPLHIQNTQKVAPKTCCHCGSRRVFEFQLMPALINLLRFSPDTDPVLEYGTVLIYTCERSCWTSDAIWRQELAIVEADPDQMIFHSSFPHQQQQQQHQQ